MPYTVVTEPEPTAWTMPAVTPLGAGAIVVVVVDVVVVDVVVVDAVVVVGVDGGHAAAGVSETVARSTVRVPRKTSSAS